MAMTMDIRLNYGAWPGIDGDDDDAGTTDSETSGEGSPPLNPTHQIDEFEQDSISRRQPSSALSLSDLFSDSGYSIQSEDFLTAELNMASSVNTSQTTSQNTSRPPHPRDGFVRTSLFNPTQTFTHDSPVIDLTDSPPQISVRPTATPSGLSSPSTSQEHPNMPPTLRRRVQSRRAPPEVSPPPHTEGHPRKRRRLSERSTAVERPQTATNNVSEIEAVDLTEVNDESDLSRAISKQQQDAVQAQMKDNQVEDSAGRTPLSSYKCPICMDTPEDATSTVCGHLFCHKCIIDTLRFSEQQRRDDAGTSKAKGTCPVCRKPLARKDEPGLGRTLVPLEIKLSTRRDLKGKGVVGRRGQTSAVPARMLAKTERESSADMWRDLTNLDHN